MRVKINIRDIEKHLAEHPNQDKTIRELARIWGYAESTMRKKCQTLVLDEQSHVALLVYQRQVKLKNGKYVFRLCGGYCVVDWKKMTDDFHVRIDETMGWAHNLAASVTKLIWKSFAKEANRKVLPAHRSYMKRLKLPIPDDYESYYQFE